MGSKIKVNDKIGYVLDWYCVGDVTYVRVQFMDDSIEEFDDRLVEEIPENV